MRRILVLLALGVMGLFAQASSPPQAPEERDLDQHISETLRQSKYSWVTEAAVQGRARQVSSGPIQAIRQLLDRIKGTFRWAVNSFLRWLDRLFSGNGNLPEPKQQPHMPHVSLWLLGIFGGLAILAAAFLMRRQSPRATSPGSQPVVVTRIEDEQTLASALPEQEWLRLADEYFGRGEGRLAVRALHLAELAVLADRGLVNISAYKTTADYRADLRRRVHAGVITDLFARNGLRYESTWYGTHEVTDDLVEHFRQDLDRLRDLAYA